MPSSKDHIHCMIHLKVRILEWVAMPSSKDHIHCMIHLKVISNGHALKKKTHNFCGVSFCVSTSV